MVNGEKQIMNWTKGLIVGSGDYYDTIESKSVEQGMVVGRIRIDYEDKDKFMDELKDATLNYGHEILLMDDKTPDVYSLIETVKKSVKKVLVVLNSSDPDILKILSNHGYVDVVGYNVDINEMTLLFRGKKPLMYIPGIGFRSRGNYVVIEKKGLLPEAVKYKQE